MAQPALSKTEITDLLDMIRSLPPVLTPAKPIREPYASIVSWVNRARQSEGSRISHPRVALFAAHHGAAVKHAEGQDEKVRTENYLKQCQSGDKLLNALCQAADADLRIYEMDLDSACGDTDTGPSLDEDSMNMPIAYGMMTVEPGVDLLILAGFGAGSTVAAKRLIGQRLEQQASGRDGGLDLMMAGGGFETCALAGAIIAARLAGIPVLIENLAALAALVLLAAENPAITDHCAVCLPGGREIEGLQELLPGLPRLFTAENDEPGNNGAALISQIRTAMVLFDNRY